MLIRAIYPDQFSKIDNFDKMKKKMPENVKSNRPHG